MRHAVSPRVFSAVALLVCAPLSVSHLARAQSVLAENSPAAKATSSAMTEGGIGLEEIVVTARRREENIQKVPIAITVVSQQALQNNNVQTLGDLQYLVPSLSSSGQLNRDNLNVSIRGQGSNSVSQPGVITYINEVPIPTDANGWLAGGPGLFFDLENLQVLKGPQGTLFGRNSVGGALLLQTARPTNSFDGRIQLGYGNYNNREVDGAVNVPIVNDTLLARVAFSGQKRDGFTKILGEPGHPNGIDADDRDFWAVRGTVTFRPNGEVQNDTIATYQNYNNHGSPWFITAVNPAGGQIPVPVFYPTYAALFAQQQALGIHTHLPLDVQIESRGSNLSVDNITRVDLTDHVTFRNIFGYDVSNTTTTNDQDSTNLPILENSNTPTDDTVHQFTEEAQLLGKSFGERLNWIAGAFDLRQSPPADFVRNTSEIFGGFTDRGYKRGDKSKALYAQGTYDLAALVNGLGVTAGLRYTWDDRFQCSYVGPLSSAHCAVTSEAKSSALTWTGGLNYELTPETLLYLTSRRGYRAGGSNGVDTTGASLPNFGPEFVTDVELGVKSSGKVGEIPVHANAAVYYQRYSQIQVQQYIVVGGVPLGVTANAAAARLWGLELEAQAQLTNDLQVGASFDSLHFAYTSFGAGVDPVAVSLTSKDNRPPYKYGINIRYRVPLTASVGDVSVQAHWDWQASSGDFNQQLGGLIPQFGLLNLSGNWDAISGTPIDASFFVSNALNKVYKIGGLGFYSLLGFNVDRYGEPRMYGVRVRYRFGAGARQ